MEKDFCPFDNGCGNTNLVLILHASMPLLHSVYSHPPRWCHPEVSEDPEQSSTPCHRHQDTLDQWTLGLQFQWRWCSVENRQRCRLIQEKASQEDLYWCWHHGELQTGNLVCLHRGIYPDKYRTNMRRSDFLKQLTLEQFRPGLVVVAAITRTATGFGIECHFC